MYTYCTIQWIDDLTTSEVIIKDDHTVDKDDDKIFFYGLSPEKIRRAMETEDVCEGEWKVIDIYGTFDQLL